MWRVLAVISTRKTVKAQLHVKHKTLAKCFANVLHVILHLITSKMFYVLKSFEYVLETVVREIKPKTLAKICANVLCCTCNMVLHAKAKAQSAAIARMQLPYTIDITSVHS